jgi:hypothetical protein
LSAEKLYIIKNMAKISVREIKKGMQGLFTDEPVHKNSIILVLKGEYSEQPTRTSIRVRDKNVEHFEGAFMNHHCNPNAKIFIIGGVEEGIVVAKQDIREGEEITFDYETTEPKLSAPFHCNCHGRLIVGKYGLD